MLHEHGTRFRSDPPRSGSAALPIVAHEFRRQQRNVLEALLERRQPDAGRPEPVQEIRPQTAGGHEPIRIFARRRQDAEVRSQGPGRAQRPVFARFQGSQQLRLHRGRNLG